MKYIVLVTAILLFSAVLIDRRISRKRRKLYLAQQQFMVEYQNRDPNEAIVFDVEGITIIGGNFEFEPDE